MSALQPICQGTVYICPKCHGQLTEARQAYTCVECTSLYPVTDGIPDFCPETHLYWGELSADQMSEVIAYARENGYEKAAEVTSRYEPGLREYLLSEYRGDWVFHCVPLSGWKTCLDIGSGWGTLSRALLRYGLKVWSLEIMRERLAFQEAFKRREQLHDLTLVRGRANRLPFADHSFDLVAANGIIQWVGLADPSRPVSDLQREFLKECRRVLKPDGVLCLGCENRYGFSRLMGEKDHSGLRFTSVMPRKLADLTVRWFRRTGGKFSRRFRSADEWHDYRTYTYSARGYEKLLKSCQFETVETYWAHPSNNVPQFMGRIKDPRSLKALLDYNRQTLDFHTRGSVVSRAALRLRFIAGWPTLSRLLLTFFPDLVLFARPASVPEHGSLEAAVGSYAMRFGGSNKTIWWGVRRKAGNTVVKMARFPNDERAVQADEEEAARYNHMDVSKAIHGCWTLYDEPLLDARPVDSLSERENLAGVSILANLQRQTHQGFWKPGGMDEEIGRNLGAFCDLVSDTSLHRLAEQACERLSGVLGGARLPVVREHGDFTRSNILLGAEGQIYLIDWSHSREAGEPLFDFSMLSRTYWHAWRQGARRKGKQVPATAPALRPMMTAFTGFSSVVPDVIYAYYPYALLRRINRSAPWYRQTLIEHFRDREFPQPD